jgi:hypothetical protein
VGLGAFGAGIGVIAGGGSGLPSERWRMAVGGRYFRCRRERQATQGSLRGPLDEYAAKIGRRRRQAQREPLNRYRRRYAAMRERIPAAIF